MRGAQLLACLIQSGAKPPDGHAGRTISGRAVRGLPARARKARTERPTRTSQSDSVCGLKAAVGVRH